jgi:hypothetical protein
MLQALQIVGAISILAGFIASQSKLLSNESVLYLVLNAAGSGLLAVLALLDDQWGFLLLEGTWAIVSVIGLFRIRQHA